MTDPDIDWARALFPLPAEGQPPPPWPALVMRDRAAALAAALRRAGHPAAALEAHLADTPAPAVAGGGFPVPAMLVFDAVTAYDAATAA